MKLPLGALVRDKTLPELGHGRVVGHTDAGRTVIAFSRTGELREMFAADHPELIRLRLHPGQPAEIEGGEAIERGVVARAPAFREDTLWTYGIRVGERRIIAPESRLAPASPDADDPAARILARAWDPPGRFLARRALLEAMSRWQENSMGTPPLLGARVHPLPHQLHAARTVLLDRVPRFVLADEVGLGKTIEAGIVIQALQARDPGLRVLVIAPGAMSRQWLCELFLRFGDQVYLHVDAPRLATASHQDLVSAPRVIASTTALESDPAFAARLLLEARWNLVVIDEAHQVPPAHPLYETLLELAKRCDALLALSATPSQRDEEGLLGLLALVEPERHDPRDVATFKARLEREPRSLGRRIIRTRRAAIQALGTLVCQRRLEVLDYPVRPGERAFVEHVAALPLDPEANPSPAALGLLGVYREAACTTPIVALGLLRRRAAALERLTAGGESPALDALAALSRDPGPAEAEYLRERLVDEVPALPDERAWLERAVELVHAWMLEAPERCARFEAARAWVVRRAQQGGKVLVFAQEREVVAAFAESIAERLGVDAVGALHHRVDEGQVAELALRFQQPGGLKVLVSDELGGDGRNFQIASAVVHLTTPWSVSRVEQRIGRLDRMGREPGRDVLSLVVRGPSPVERALVRLHREVFDVYQRSLGGLEFLLPRLQQGTLRAACEGAGALEALVEPFTAAVQDERARQDAAAADDLAGTKERLDEATELAEILAATDGTDDIPAIAGWAASLGMRLQGDGSERYLWRWRWEDLRRTPPGLHRHGAPPAEGRVTKRGTFSRAKALGDESLELFAPGHPVVEALVRDLLSAPDGRASVFSRPRVEDPGPAFYVQALVRTELDPDADVAPGLLYRAWSRLWMQVRAIWVAVDPAGDEPIQVIDDPARVRRLERAPADGPRAIDPDDASERFDPAWLDAPLLEAVERALGAFRARRSVEVRHAAEDLRADLAPDLAWFEEVLRAGDEAARARAEAEIAARRGLIDCVLQEAVVLEGLAVIVPVGPGA